jgi:hypothetical protein
MRLVPVTYSPTTLFTIRFCNCDAVSRNNGHSRETNWHAAVKTGESIPAVLLSTKDMGS